MGIPRISNFSNVKVLLALKITVKPPLGA